MKVASGILAFLACAAAARAQSTTLVPTGATWKYLDNGTDQGTAWRASGFNDSGWASGPAQLGYGDGDEATVVSFGGNASDKYVTTYFRRSFNVVSAASYLSSTLRIRRDDGAAVYLNGTEVFRTNLAAGATYTTLASGAGDDGNTFQQTAVNPALLVDGTNVFAVEIHQSSVTSSDISFDLEYTASTSAAPVTVTRGPYLQTGTPSSVVVRWRTSSATDSRVRRGPSPGNLTTTVDAGASVTDHEVTLTGLSPNTTYYYSVGSTTATLAGDDANHFFLTSPPAGTSKATRVWVLGDAGTQSAAQTNVKNAYYGYTGATHTDLWLMLGDNAYSTGTDAEYQGAVFDMYPTMLRKSVLWSTRGNHESDAGGAGSTYYGIFTLPTAAQAGGTASGTEAYYSFDYGNVHFIGLDSQGSSRAPGGAMATWLAADLAATVREWIVAFWHHPPYSKGSHNSDTESQLVEMRTNFLPMLEAAGVDLVLCGHSHSYERSFLLDGHYGDSTTFSAAMQVDAGSGQGAGAYQKPAGVTANNGAVYVVAGSSGQISGGTLNHPAMYVSLNNLGSMVLDFDGSRLDARFLRENGVVADSFAILKAPLPAVTVAATDAGAGEPANPGTFTVSRGAAAGTPLTVNYTMSGTASNGTDYATLSGSVTIPGGAASAVVTVSPSDDPAIEGTETVVLTLAGGAGYSVGTPSVATVNLADDDSGGAGDADGDGLPDAWETTHFGGTLGEDGMGDPDGDGLDNAGEYAAGTDPNAADSDGDGMRDGWEVGFGLNPTSPADAGGDLDGDGFSNLAEFQAGTDPANSSSFPAPRRGGGGGGGGCGATGLEALLLAFQRRFVVNSWRRLRRKC